MKMINKRGEAIYYNIVTKHGQTRYIVKALSGQVIPGRDREKRQSRSFAQEHQADAWLQRHGYKVI